nr:acyltransferase family protein [uncultured Faecalibacillus sp.]
MFCGGYAAYIQKEKSKKYKINRIIKLMCNYWIVLLLTCFVGFILGNPDIPKNILSFILNAFLISTSYVGAWWFMQTYVLLTFTNSFLIKCVDNFKWYINLVVIFMIYVIAYYFRMIHSIHTQYYILNIFINMLVLYGTSLFPYVVGIIFRKYNITSMIRKSFKKHNTFIGIFIIAMCLIFHIIIKSMIVAPFISIIFIIGFSLLNLNGTIKEILLFFGKHSTNMWLVHMQFYMIFFKEIVFCTDTVLGCFIILIVLSLISSYFIFFIMKQLAHFKNYILIKRTI